MKKDEKKYIFDGWFSINIPEEWEYSVDEDLLTIYSKENAQGVIQISFFHRKMGKESIRSIAEKHLNKFLTQYNVSTDINDCKVIESPNHTVATTCGECEEEFIKVWTIINEKKMLLVTYLNPNKTKELSKAEEIVDSIIFVI
jgi:hypothetical protein